MFFEINVWAILCSVKEPLLISEMHVHLPQQQLLCHEFKKKLVYLFCFKTSLYSLVSDLAAQEIDLDFDFAI